MFKYTKATFLRPLLITLMLLTHIKTVCQENSFFKIKQSLWSLETNAIEDILKGFPLIPNDECITTLRDIESIRNTTKNKLLNNAQKDYCFEPKNVDLSFMLFNNQPEITLNIVSFYTKQCAQLLDIKSDAVCCAIPTSEQMETLPKDSYAFVTSQDFLKEDTLTIYVNLDHFNKVHSVFHVAIPTIMHELIHGLEAHPIVRKILMDSVIKYYPEQNSTNLYAHPLFIALQKSHELIADIAPKMLFQQLALLEVNRHFFHKWGIITCEGSDNIHPTVHDLNEWNEKIIKCHENLTLYDTLTFPFKVPQTKYLLIQQAARYVIAGTCGFLLSALISKNKN